MGESLGRSYNLKGRASYKGVIAAQECVNGEIKGSLLGRGGITFSDKLGFGSSSRWERLWNSLHAPLQNFSKR